MVYPQIVIPGGQYGIDIQIQRYPKMTLSYTLRSSDESTINGSSMLGEDSTITVIAQYTQTLHGNSCFLPLPIFASPHGQTKHATLF